VSLVRRGDSVAHGQLREHGYVRSDFDNANGIGELPHGPEARQIMADLDAAGNTTRLTKAWRLARQ